MGQGGDATARCRFDDLRRGSAVEGRGLRGVLAAETAGDVPALLAEVERAARGGRYAAGFVAYEAAPAFDAALVVHPRPHPLPVAWFALFDELAPACPLPTAPAAGAAPTPRILAPETTEGAYRAGVARIHAAIAGGHTYQVNYTTRLRAPLAERAPALYARLCAAQRGAYHALLEADGWAIACGSPELFFAREGRRVTTRPMKGTAPRGVSAAEDRAAAAWLLTSEKERCENVIVVDLLRNDLGRVAEPGTVRVEGLCELERYPTVWQLTSTVTGEVGPDVELAQLFRALFPCGSVTGAPKPSTMAIIAGLERSPRGPYCGAIGYVGPGAAETTAARFAVGIRTAVLDLAGGSLEYGVGGGITWYADAGAEWAELWAKAAVLSAGGG